MVAIVDTPDKELKQLMIGQIPPPIFECEAWVLVFYVYINTEAKIKFKRKKIMMNMKEMNRELTMEELETFSGAVFAEEMSREKIEEHMLERMSYKNFTCIKKTKSS